MWLKLFVHQESRDILQDRNCRQVVLDGEALGGRPEQSCEHHKYPEVIHKSPMIEKYEACGTEMANIKGQQM